MIRYLKLSSMLWVLFFISCNDLEEDDCRACYGRGYTYCDVCNNTGDCAYCEYGFKECSFCVTGYIWNGVGYEKCPVCKGNYRQICPLCHGSYLNKCQACHGKKEVCVYCKGTGKKNK